MDFDTGSELAKLKAQSALRKKRPYSQRRSVLDRYTYELLSLHQAGANVAELQRWLASKRIKVVHTTVARWIKRHG